MKSLEQEIARKVKQWLEHAEDDLRLAEHGMTLTSGVPYRLIAYHAQQCVEKHLKAYLVYHKVDFPYTHNISLLLNLCLELAAWTEEMEDAKELTSYAITTRYPGIDEEVSEDEVRQAIEIAVHVQEIVKEALIHEGLDIL